MTDLTPVPIPEHLIRKGMRIRRVQTVAVDGVAELDTTGKFLRQTSESRSTAFFRMLPTEEARREFATDEAGEARPGPVESFSPAQLDVLTGGQAAVDVRDLPPAPVDVAEDGRYAVYRDGEQEDWRAALRARVENGSSGDGGAVFMPFLMAVVSTVGVVGYGTSLGMLLRTWDRVPAAAAFALLSLALVSTAVGMWLWRQTRPAPPRPIEPPDALGWLLDPIMRGQTDPRTTPVPNPNFTSGAVP